MLRLPVFPLLSDRSIPTTGTLFSTLGQQQRLLLPKQLRNPLCRHLKPKWQPLWQRLEMQALLFNSRRLPLQKAQYQQPYKGFRAQRRLHQQVWWGRRWQVQTSRLKTRPPLWMRLPRRPWQTSKQWQTCCRLQGCCPRQQSSRKLSTSTTPT